MRRGGGGEAEEADDLEVEHVGVRDLSTKYRDSHATRTESQIKQF